MYSVTSDHDEYNRMCLIQQPYNFPFFPNSKGSSETSTSRRKYIEFRLKSVNFKGLVRKTTLTGWKIDESHKSQIKKAQRQQKGIFYKSSWATRQPHLHQGAPEI